MKSVLTERKACCKEQGNVVIYAHFLLGQELHQSP